MSPSDKRPVRRPRVFGIALLDDIVVDVLGTLAQVGIVAIMLPVLLVVLLGSVMIAVLIGGVMAAVLKELGAPAQVIIIPGALALIAALTATAVIGIKVYRRLPRNLHAVAFEEYDDAEPEPELGPPPATTSPSLAELDARLARGSSGQPAAVALAVPPPTAPSGSTRTDPAAPSRGSRALVAVSSVVGGGLGFGYVYVVGGLVGDGPLWLAELPLIIAVSAAVITAVRTTSKVIENAAMWFASPCVLFALLFLGAD